MLKKFLKTEEEQNKKEEKEPEEEKGSNWSSSNLVKRENLDVFFNADVEPESCMKLMMELRKGKRQSLNIQTHLDLEEPPPVKLHISSHGGYIVSGWPIIDMILASRVPIHTIVEGMAYSMGAAISVVGHKRLIRPHGSILIHQLSGFMVGTYREMQDDAENDTKIMEMLYQLFTKYTKLTRKKVETLMTHDKIFFPEDCLKMGFADEILEVE